MISLTLEVAVAVPPEPSDPEWLDPPVLYAWGPEVEGRCLRRTWVKGTGWTTLGKTPHSCPLQEAVFTMNGGIVVRWTGSKLSAQRGRRVLELPLPLDLELPLDIGFAVGQGAWWATVTDRSGTTWGLRGEEALRAEGGLSSHQWKRGAIEPNQRRLWHRRDTQSDEQALSDGEALPLVREADQWSVGSEALTGLPMGDWVAFAPPPTSSHRGSYNTRVPTPPPNRAIVARRCSVGESCEVAAPLYIAMESQALAVLGPTGPVYISQQEDTIAVVDGQGLWLVDARSGTATLEPGINRVWWTR